ncbi:patatin-like phospholipase RssA [Yersinia kristensenii]|uniref:patatin-like phospholipase RssA n=1 Tax=Yersinia kristensenii TaxID=28152 RepID=UPI0001A54EE2|nr:patatin-like phospholipase RssA [Yersinia kristensenii]EEP91415.1 NTE family protein rssA [Yersinia kristensenii ATCC 33638]PEH52202.1 patatin family protein [Yersinia kristensenii]SUP70007.1 NTE family protein rssA [Yersinia kristensenii]
MRKSKVGLALGAGAAKGWAHIGVINALKKMGVEIDVVAGCSVGSLVGAAYASDHLEVMERWVRSFKYWDVIRMMDFSWRRGGLLRGERVFNVVNEIIEVQDIAECALPFGCVVTNLTTGRELWFTEGDIKQAIRASCSMPGLFSPVLFEGYWLVDGAVVNPVPISLARAMGADIVIAVDLQHDAHLIAQDIFSPQTPIESKFAEIPDNWHRRLKARITDLTSNPIKNAPSAMEIMSTSIQVLENRLKRNRMAGDPPDVLIQPYCPQISMLDFHRADESIAAGQLAVEKCAEQLYPLIKHR